MQIETFNKSEESEEKAARAIRHKDLNRLVNASIISRATRQHAFEFLYPPIQWTPLLNRLLLWFGWLLTITGVLFFFAYNWQALSRLQKLAIVEIACVFAVLFSWKKLDHLQGKTAISIATVLLGIFLAVFGQVYQTGADSYQLFLTWALLALPWALIAKFEILWFVWLIIANLFLALYWQQTGGDWKTIQTAQGISSIVMNSLFLLLKEYAVAQAIPWLQANWPRILICLLLISLGNEGVRYILNQENPLEMLLENSSLLIFCILGTLVHIGVYWLYRFIRPNLICLTFLMLSICLLAMHALRIHVVKTFLPASLFYIAMSIITLLLFTFSAIYLKRIYQKTHDDTDAY